MNRQLQRIDLKHDSSRELLRSRSVCNSRRRSLKCNSIYRCLCERVYGSQRRFLLFVEEIVAAEKEREFGAVRAVLDTFSYGKMPQRFGM